MSLSCFDDYFLTNMLICHKLLCLSICICELLENIINMSAHLFISFVIMHNMSNFHINVKLCFNSCFYDKLFVLQVKKNVFKMFECPFSHKNFTKIKLGLKTRKIYCFIHFQQKAIDHLLHRIDWFLPRMYIYWNMLTRSITLSTRSIGSGKILFLKT